MGITVMVVGGGAREHAISEQYEKSADRIILAPGNDFSVYRRNKEVIIDKDCSLRDSESIYRAARKYGPDLIDVAQDDALAAGTVDYLKGKGFEVFGPEKKAARLEWDKIWAREFMKRKGIPQPKNFAWFTSPKQAERFLESLYRAEPGKLVYVKATGLCGGKGAFKSRSKGEALESISKVKRLGKAGKRFLIEDGLLGEEFSYYAITDGKSYRIFNSAQDNKRVWNFDEGDQTGGMGAVSPAMVTAPYSDVIEKDIVRKTIDGMREEGNPYAGILYVGGMACDDGAFVIEDNSRWGDPECEAVLPSLETDYLDIVSSCLEGRLGEIEIKQDSKTRVCVVGASKGYPGEYSSVKGKRIYGLEEAMKHQGVKIYGAGIDVIDGKFYANGGRLFSVVAEGKNIIEARQRAYSALAEIFIEGNSLHYRTDIGWRDVERFLTS